MFGDLFNGIGDGDEVFDDGMMFEDDTDRMNELTRRHYRTINLCAGGRQAARHGPEQLVEDGLSHMNILRLL